MPSTPPAKGNSVKTVRTTCCIVGGGPAGMMLGFLLARAGVDVTVLEKHNDFLRDFRGDTIHASTLELMHELGLLEDFLALPHQKATTVAARFGRDKLTIGDMRHLPTRCKFVAFMPQWDFLDFVAAQGRRYPGFDLRMGTKAKALLRNQDGRVVGVAARLPEGAAEIRADLVVACDGRHSELRAQSGLPLRDFGAPLDVLWFRIPRRPEDPAQLLGQFDRGRGLVLINRGDYWQCAALLVKDGLAALKHAGFAVWRDGIAAMLPFATERLTTLQGWDEVKLLSVQVNRLRRWHNPGLLCIGDAAHAMSPIGGVGINLAIQDAVAAANILHAALLRRDVTDALLAKVQSRRMLPTRLVQGFQLRAQDFLLREVLRPSQDDSPMSAPWPLRLLNAFPPLRRLPARFIAIGYRPEHIKTPDISMA